MGKSTKYFWVLLCLDCCFQKKEANLPKCLARRQKSEKMAMFCVVNGAKLTTRENETKKCCFSLCQLKPECPGPKFSVLLMNMPAGISVFSSNNETSCGSVDFGPFLEKKLELFLRERKYWFFSNNFPHLLCCWLSSVVIDSLKLLCNGYKKLPQYIFPF